MCVAGQHREMLHQVLDIFNRVPDYDLDIMSKNQTLTDITEKALTKLYGVIKNIKPDLILVHGDTTTTLTDSLAGFYNKVKVGHVEAGLRTYNKYSPFPEEMNRKLMSCIADLHFAPTKIAKNNLLNEGINQENIYVTVNTAIDTLKITVRDNYSHHLLSEISDNRIILLTPNRKEDIGDNMRDMFRAIKKGYGRI